MLFAGWSKFYEKTDSPWDSDQVSPAIKDYLDDLLACSKKDKTDIRFLIPLCGASVDLLHIYQQGLTVIGCDLVETNAVRLFESNGIKYQKEQVGNFVKYQVIMNVI